MAVNGQIEMTWGDGEHVFNIAKIGQVLELEDKCNGSGVMEIFTRLRENKWRYNDMRETIRLALIGGGKTPIEALNLVKKYVDDRPWQENVHVAVLILMASIVGVPGDEVGKERAEGTKTESPSDSSAPRSMGQVQSLDGHPDKSTTLPFGNLLQP